MTDPRQQPEELLRFADILTTASAAANYLGGANVDAQHLLYGVAILTGEMALEDLGRAISPLVRRTPPGMGGTVDPLVRELAQRWFTALGSHPDASIAPAQLAEFVGELHQIRDRGEESGVPPD